MKCVCVCVCLIDDYTCKTGETHGDPGNPEYFNTHMCVHVVYVSEWTFVCI